MRQRAPWVARILRAATIAVATCAAVASPRAASATPAGSPTPTRVDAKERIASTLVHDAITLERSGQTKLAAERLARATKTTGAITTGIELARALEAEGKLARALSTYRSVFEMPPMNPAERNVLAAARPPFEALVREIPRVSFVGAFPDDASVTLDGAEVVQTRGETLEVDPGDHVVTVEAPGRATWRTKFQVARGDAREIGVQAGPDVEIARDSSADGTLGEERSATKPADAADDDGGASAARRLYRPQAHAAASTEASSQTVADERARRKGRVVFRDCLLVPCSEAIQSPASAAFQPPHEERVDKRILSSLTGNGTVGVLATQGFLLFTAPALSVPNARVGASITPSGSSYVALTGLW